MLTHAQKAKERLELWNKSMELLAKRKKAKRTCEPKRNKKHRLEPMFRSSEALALVNLIRERAMKCNSDLRSKRP
jgi:hypothetical protein